MPRAKKDTDRLTGLPFWGAVIGLIGGVVGIIGGVVSLWDKFIPPSIDVMGVLPVRVDSTLIEPNLIRERYGVSFIIQIHNKNQTAFITGLDISGKMYLSPIDWESYSKLNNIYEIAKECSSKRPYHRISWSCWLTESQVAIKLEPDEIRFIKFTLIEPGPMVGIIRDERYLGFDNISKTPDIYDYKPYVYWIFNIVLGPNKKFWPYGLRNEFVEGEINLYIRMGSKSVKINPNKYKPFTMISINDWSTKPGQKLFYESF